MEAPTASSASTASAAITTPADAPASPTTPVVPMPDMLDVEIGPTITEIKRLQALVEKATEKTGAATTDAKVVFDAAATKAAETKTAEDKAARDDAAKYLKVVTAAGEASVAASRRRLNDFALRVCAESAAKNLKMDVAEISHKNFAIELCEAAKKLGLVLTMKILGEVKVILLRFGTIDGGNLADLRVLMGFFCGSDALAALNAKLNQWATDAKMISLTVGGVKYTLYITSADVNNNILPDGHHSDASSIPLVVQVNPNTTDPSTFDIVRVCVQDPITDHSADVTTPAKLQYALATAFPKIFAQNDPCAFAAWVFGALIVCAHELKDQKDDLYPEIMGLKGNQKLGKELQKQIKSEEERDMDTRQSVLDAYEETRSRWAPGSMIRRVLKGPLSPVVNQELIAALAIYHIEAVALGDISDVEKVACIADRRNAERLAAKQAAAKLAADKKAAKQAIAKLAAEQAAAEEE